MKTILYLRGQHINFYTQVIHSLILTNKTGLFADESAKKKTRNRCAPWSQKYFLKRRGKMNVPSRRRHARFVTGHKAFAGSAYWIADRA